ncbi:hypothetical protein GLP02_24465, partial [Escherichia coli]|nr:hypothetical protein [Escherichia coli]
DIVQSEGCAISISTLATVTARHPEGEFSVQQGHACGFLLQKCGPLLVLEGDRAVQIIHHQEGGLWGEATTPAVVVGIGD